ncbi:MAG: alcohol dehydrogenase catalytic domain-containing protein, partial [Anaerolineales bacterium]|nr:alcohol dehydrogenase catalytic domain-containing protein [Anaerolineales bacterium]MCB0013927.1 alcohol dehydrogenase catalytic domain-containing protein [Anaerolineales bacterium]
MQAAQYVSQGKVSFVSVPDPAPAAGEVLLQMNKVAVCGSDVTQLYYGDNFPEPPGVSGHECV